MMLSTNIATNSIQPSPSQLLRLDHTHSAGSKQEILLIKSEKSLAQFMEIGKYYDFIVVDPENQCEHKLHKLILACHSDYFQAIFDSTFMENQLHQTTIQFPDPRHLLPHLFRYMYTGELMVSIDTVVPMLQQAEYYQVTELIDLLKQEIKKRLLPKHVLRLLKDSVQYQMTEIMSLTSCVLAEHFDAVEWDAHGEDLNFLPVDIMLDILNNRALTLETEYRVYRVISNYTTEWARSSATALATPAAVFSRQNSNGRRMTEQDCLDLYGKVYFEHLTVEQLEEAYENPHVPRNLLCEGLFVSLRMALGKPVNQDRLGRKYTKHMDTKRGRDFIWSGNQQSVIGNTSTANNTMDTNGVIYWLGTQLDEKHFHNPHQSGHVLCRMSSIQAGRPENLVSRLNQPTCTMSQRSAWISVDFGPSHFVLKPTHYSLKHGHWRDNVNLRRWRLEASTDGEQWKTISLHDPDESLGGEYGVCTWPVQSDRWYRVFRISTVGTFFVQVCGVEFYGNLLPRTLDAAATTVSSIATTTTACVATVAEVEIKEDGSDNSIIHV